MKDNGGYGRLLPLGGSGLQAGANRNTCPCQVAWMVWGWGVSVGLGVPVGPGRLQLTFPSPSLHDELYGLVQVQDQAQACPDLDLQ